MSDTEAIKPGDMAEVDPAAMELIVRIMQQSAKDAAWTSNQLIDAYKEQAERAEATIALIRDSIQALYDAPWTPSQQSVLAALWPSRHAVDEQIKFQGKGAF